MQNKAFGVLFDLFKYEINGTELNQETKNLISPETEIALYKLSKKHDLAHLVADALDKNGLLDDSEIAKIFRNERNMAVYRYEQINYELGEICRVLEENKIEHIPLKGAVLRAHYPQPWMRTSCDIDILVKKDELKQAITVLFKELSYKKEQENSHDVQLWAPSGVHLELHFNLVEERYKPESVRILESVWDRVVPVDGKTYQKEMTDEMFYFYHLVHMVKHFIEGGCGLRSFMDLWILNHKKTFDTQKRTALLKQGELSSFANIVETLADIWFLNERHTDTTRKLETYILNGGVYGNSENKNLVRRSKHKNKFSYFMSRLFMPYEQLCFDYPKLIHRKWLYPFYTVKRWWKKIFKGKAKSALNEVKEASKLSDESIQGLKELMQDLGLK